MTDNEIIKALEDEIHLIEYVDGFSADNVSLELLQNSLDLINRQKAEIERLEKTEIEIDDFCRRLCRMRILNGNAIASYEDLQSYIQEEKFEAVKKFAARLKYVWWDNGYESPDVDFDDFIDKLVKEMMAENECKYYDKELDCCKWFSDWKQPMPVLQPCIENPCEHYIRTPKKER